METLLVDDPVYWINSSEKIFFCRLLAMRRKLFSMYLCLDRCGIRLSRCFFAKITFRNSVSNRLELKLS